MLERLEQAAHEFAQLEGRYFVRYIYFIDTEPGDDRAQDQDSDHDEINACDPQWRDQEAHHAPRKISQQGHQPHPAGG